MPQHGPAPVRRDRRWRLPLSPQSTLHRVSVELLPPCIPGCPPRGLGLHAGIAARIAPTDCSSAGLRRCAMTDAGGCRFPPSSAPHRVFVELLQHCIPRCPPRGPGLHAGTAAKIEPPDCRSTGPRRCAVPVDGGCRFPHSQPSKGSLWSYCRLASLAGLLVGSDCTQGSPQRLRLGLPWTLVAGLRTAVLSRPGTQSTPPAGSAGGGQLSRSCAAARVARRASILTSIHMALVLPPPCSIEAGAGSGWASLGGPGGRFPPHLDGGLLCGGRPLALEVPYCFWPAVP